MQFLIDHLIAVVVASVLLGALLVLQLRGSEAAVAATSQYRSQMTTAQFATTMEREIENMRSRTETENAFAASALPSLGTGEAYRFRLRTADDGEGGVYTRQFSFPTLADPEDLGASGILVVSYLVEPTGETVQVDGRERALYQATRHEFRRGGPVVWTDVITGLVDFDVTAFFADGTEVRDNAGVDMATAESPPRIELEIRTAPSFGVSRTGQVSTSTRHARSIRVPAAMVAALPTVPDPTTPGGIPLLPGDPGAGAALPEVARPGGTTPPSTDTPTTTPPATDRPGGGDTGGGDTGGTDTPTTTPPTTDTPTTTPPTTDTPTTTPPITDTPTTTPPTTDRPPATPPTTGPAGHEVITICHVQGRQKKTVTGTHTQLEAHRAHPNDYLGECR